MGRACERSLLGPPSSEERKEERKLAVVKRGRSWEEVQSRGKELCADCLSTKRLFSFLELKRKRWREQRGLEERNNRRESGEEKRVTGEEGRRKIWLYVESKRTRLLLFHGQHGLRRGEIKKLEF